MISEAAWNLYSGGWRAENREQLVDEYKLTEDEAQELASELAEIALYEAKSHRKPW